MPVLAPDPARLASIAIRSADMAADGQQRSRCSDHVIGLDRKHATAPRLTSRRQVAATRTRPAGRDDVMSVRVAPWAVATWIAGSKEVNRWRARRNREVQRATVRSEHELRASQEFSER